MQRCKKVFERSFLFVESEAAGSASSPLGEKLTLRIDAQEYSRGCTARVSSYLQSLNGSINLLQPRFPKSRDGGTGRRSGLKIRRCLALWGFNSPSRHHHSNKSILLIVCGHLDAPSCSFLEQLLNGT